MHSSMVKPQAPAPRVDNIPATLTERPQWVSWRYEYAPGRSKPWAKVPISPHGATKASSTDPKTWASLEDALQRYETDRLDGIGYVLTLEDALVGIDLDHVYPDGTLAAWAAAEVNALATYTEISPSGEGLRLFIRGSLPRQGIRHGPVEAYQTARFLTITGQRLPETPATVEARDLHPFCQRHFPRLAVGGSDKKPHTVGGGASPPEMSLHQCQASALSILNCRVEGLECGACGVDVELPLDPALLRVTGR
jgi:hypothetical protein